MLQISTKSTAQFLNNSRLKMELKKRSFQYGKVASTVRTQLLYVTVCAQSGRHLHRHWHVFCADRTFSAAAAGLPVYRPCSINLPQKSVVSKFLQQLSGTVTLTLPLKL